MSASWSMLITTLPGTGNHLCPVLGLDGPDNLTIFDAPKKEVAETK